MMKPSVQASPLRLFCKRILTSHFPLSPSEENAIERAYRCLNSVFRPNATCAALCLLLLISLGGSRASAQSVPDSVGRNLPPSSTTTYVDSVRMEVKNRGQLVLSFVSFMHGNSDVMPNYADNAERLQKLNAFFAGALHTDFVPFAVAEIKGTCSIEGSLAHNQDLAARRALSFRNFLDDHYKLSTRIPVRLNAIAEDWDALEEMVRQADSTCLPQKQDILDIIREVPAADSREAAILKLDSGRPYNYLREQFFPLMRKANIILQYDLRQLMENRSGERVTDADIERVVAAIRPMTDAREIEHFMQTALVRIDSMAAVIRDTITIHQTDTITRVVVRETPAKPQPIFALKTNLLYDLALLPNIAIEMAIGNRWTIEAEAQWCWWDTDQDKRYTDRIQLFGLELRKWLGHKDSFCGHYLGAYGMGGTFDLKWNEVRGYQSNFSFSAGLSYGYSMRLSKHFNLELGLAVGYVNGKYDKYHYDALHKRYNWESTHRLRYIGPTKAKISLVYKR